MNLPVDPLAGQRVGYARISSASQNLDGQTDALAAAGCEKVFADTASGKLAERPELTACLGYLRAGDTLVVWRLDRLGRSLRHLVETVNALADRGVAFASLHEGIDTSTSTGRLVFHIFAALAEFERELIAERAAVGRAAARGRGRRGGRSGQPLPGAGQFPSPAQPSTGPSAALADQHQHRPAHEQLNLHQHLPRLFSALTAVPMFLDPGHGAAPGIRSPFTAFSSWDANALALRVLT